MTSDVSSAWREIICSIPGYDPFRDAGECTFDEERAQNAVDFFSECMTHVKGVKAGVAFILERWQMAIVGNLFGWIRPDGTRRYREAFIYVPKKNGKTILTAGIGLFLFFCDGEPSAEIYAAAADKEQAAILFEIAKEQVLSEPALIENAEVYRRAIVLKGSTSSFKVVSSDAKRKHGYNPSGVIIDELHAIDNRDLVDALTTGSGARRQPLTVYLTTADFVRPSPCNEKLAYAKKVRDGATPEPHPEFLPVIYEASRDDDWKDPAVWARVNPCLGVSVPLDYFRSECQKAQDIPTYENTFRRLHLNVQTEQDRRFLSMDDWDKCDGSVDAKTLEGMDCWGGLDLASTKDITALVLLFHVGERWIVLPFFWVPGENAKRRESRDRFPYLTWAMLHERWVNSDGRSGKRTGLEMTDGNVADYNVVRARIGELSKKYHIQEIAADQWNARHLLRELGDDGHEVVEFGQGFKSMTAPTKELELLVTAGRLAHGGNDVLRWMAGNVAVEEDHAGNVKPSRKRSPEKIDGIVSLIMALGRAMVMSPQKKSVYTATRGLRRL